MISKAKARHIKSLQVKKYRQEEQRFTVEGAKGVQELLQSSFRTELLLATPEFLDQNQDIIRKQNLDVEEVTESELALLGSFQSNNAAIAVAVMPQYPAWTGAATGWVLALDDIRDPGNLGTIIRIADWYAVDTILASPETADCFNPKVITASMGSFTRVRVLYAPLTEALRLARTGIYGAVLEGVSVYDTDFPAAGGILVIGNESRGISEPVAAQLTHRITIPRLGGAESLNAGVATAILLDNVRRKKH